MINLLSISFSLPLTNPVLIFSIILFIILLAPVLLHYLKIPDLVGLIIAGAIIGPNGLNLMERDSSIVLFGTVGLLYLMFTAGLEMNLADFKKNSKKGIFFGLLTFTIPMTLGIVTGLYLLNLSLPTAILLASMYASHTLITYPIVSKYGLTKNRAVTVTIAGTVITDILALLVLAVIVGMTTGEFSNLFWIRLTVSTLTFGCVVLFGFPYIARWFFKKVEDQVSKYIFVLGLVFLASFLAELAGLEAIIGAFLAGIALNRLIPATSALLQRIEFVGNALFIPFFLIGVGMLIDYRAFISDWTTVQVAVVMTIVATISKFSAAWITSKTFKYTKQEGMLIFGLSNSQAAATLAAVLVGYQVIIGVTPGGDPIRLLNDNILNGTIVMILITCIIASFATQKASQEVAIEELSGEDDLDNDEVEDRILIPVSYPENVEELINLAVTIKSKKDKATMTALHVIPTDNVDSNAEKKANRLLEKASKTALATDNQLSTMLRYDDEPVYGIRNAVKELKITDIVLGLKKQGEISTNFLGRLIDKVLTRCATTTLIYRPYQPLSTIKRYIVVVPPDAEMESGFPYWLVRLWNIGKNSGSKIVFYANQRMITILKEIQLKDFIEIEFHEFSEWDDFLIISRDVKKDDALVIIMSRKNYPSYTRNMLSVPVYLNKYFCCNNYILIFPMQMGVGDQEITSLQSVPNVDPKEGFEELAGILANLFKKNK